MIHWWTCSYSVANMVKRNGAEHSAAGSCCLDSSATHDIWIEEIFCDESKEADQVPPPVHCHGQSKPDSSDSLVLVIFMDFGEIFDRGALSFGDQQLKSSSFWIEVKDWHIWRTGWVSKSSWLIATNAGKQDGSAFRSESVPWYKLIIILSCGCCVDWRLVLAYVRRVFNFKISLRSFLTQSRKQHNRARRFWNDKRKGDLLRKYFRLNSRSQIDNASVNLTFENGISINLCKNIQKILRKHYINARSDAIFKNFNLTQYFIFLFKVRRIHNVYALQQNFIFLCRISNMENWRD